MPRYALRLAFDGRRYAGTAPQPEQHTLVDHIRKVASVLQRGELVTRVRTCGRLDAGVSASALVVDIELQREWQPQQLASALTSHLQPDVAVLAIAPVADDWDALTNCTVKTYAYRLYESPVPPVLEQRCWWLRHLTASADLTACAEALIGERDLSAFAALRNDGSDDGNPVRSYHAAEWQAEPALWGEGGTLWTFRITGSGFLYKQVRGLVGAMVAVARGQATLAEFSAAIEQGRQAERIGQMAPAQGLLLEAASHEPKPAWVSLSAPASLEPAT